MNAAIKRELKIIEETPEAKTAKRLDESINRKLNHDGKWLLLNPLLSQMRLGSLTNEELEYWGRLNGFDQQYYGGIDWDNVPDNFLAECMLLPEKRTMNTLSYVHPSPDRIPVFNAASPEDIEDFLSGDLTFDELRERHPAPATP